mmetsp:Transcript_35607/g.57617  ORF Transcript_35607/g.57617 Transcript_35607/m.57617 type:complete len:207 (+) Transcript_35607:237-857(+)
MRWSQGLGFHRLPLPNGICSHRVNIGRRLDRCVCSCFVSGLFYCGRCCLSCCLLDSFFLRHFFNLLLHYSLICFLTSPTKGKKSSKASKGEHGKSGKYGEKTPHSFPHIVFVCFVGLGFVRIFSGAHSSLFLPCSDIRLFVEQRRARSWRQRGGEIVFVLIFVFVPENTTAPRLGKEGLIVLSHARLYALYSTSIVNTSGSHCPSS